MAVPVQERPRYCGDWGGWKVKPRHAKILIGFWEDVAIGTPVEVRKDDGSILATRTRSAPWLVGGHTAVIMVEGISGGYSLERVSLAATPGTATKAGETK